MNRCPIGAELFHAESRTDRRTDRHDEANSHFFFNFVNAPKNQWNKVRQNEGHEIGSLEWR
jgi:hypothetical protein